MLACRAGCCEDGGVRKYLGKPPVKNYEVFPPPVIIEYHRCLLQKKTSSQNIYDNYPETGSPQYFGTMVSEYPQNMLHVSSPGAQRSELAIFAGHVTGDPNGAENPGIIGGTPFLFDDENPKSWWVG